MVIVSYTTKSIGKEIVLDNKVENVPSQEVKSLEENETFNLTQLPNGKQAVGGI